MLSIHSAMGYCYSCRSLFTCTVPPNNHVNKRRLKPNPPPRSRPTVSLSHSQGPAPDGRPCHPSPGLFLASRSFSVGLLASFALLSRTLDVAGADSEVSDLTTTTYPCQNVETYYSGVEGLEGDSLMAQLGSILSGHRYLQYDDVWDALKFLDAADIDNPNASSEVIEVYSRRAVPKELAGEQKGWNREHLWPRSYGLTDTSSFTDLHNLRPSDANVNSSRGNKYYGECVSESSCSRPAFIEAASDTETDQESWAPPLKVRGDVARSIMYMAARYGSLPSNEGPHLRLSDSPDSGNQEMGLLSVLLRWNKIDPPSREERLRNDRICSIYQHNRNPFVDHPEYANLIWKNSLSAPQQVEQISPVNLWLNEFHYDNIAKDQNEFIEIVTGPNIDAADIQVILYNGSNGRMYGSFPLQDQVFSTTSSSTGYVIHTAYVALQNGPSDGIALVSAKPGKQPEVIQFISYEGTVKAADGPARGLESVDINLQESGTTSVNDSIGLTGNRVGEFKWKKFIEAATPGKPNIGQFF